MIKNVGLEVDLWGWVMFFFSPMSGMGHQNFVPLRGGGSCFFEEPGFHFLRLTQTPSLYFLTSPLVFRNYVESGLVKACTSHLYTTSVG